MQQLMVLEDLGYDYLHLRHEDVTTRINLKDHTFRDVTQTSVESATSDFTPCTNMDSTSVNDAWICQTPSQDLLKEDKNHIEHLIKAKDYILVPSHEDDIDPYEWSHTLATIDVCDYLYKHNFAMRMAMRSFWSELSML